MKKWITTDCWFRIGTTLIGINVVDTFRLAHYHGLLPRGKLKLVLDQEDYDGVNECSMRQFAGIMCTQLLYLAYNQKETKIDGVRRRPWNKKGQHYKDESGNADRCSAGEHATKSSRRYNIHTPVDSDEGEHVDDTKQPGSDDIRHVFIGNKQFRQLESYDSVSTSSSSDKHDMYSNMRREGMSARQILARVDDSNVLQQMRDIGGGRHTACKLPVTVSKGKATNGKRYVNQCLCKWCNDSKTKSSVRVRAVDLKFEPDTLFLTSIDSADKAGLINVINNVPG